MRLAPSPWERTSLSCHRRSKSWLTVQSSATSSPTSDMAPARATSARNAATRKPARLSQSACADRMRAFPKTSRKILRWFGESSVVRQEGCRGAVPSHDVPQGGFDDGGANLQRIQKALQSRRNAGRGLVADFGRSAETEHEEMFPLDIGQHQAPGDPFKDISRWRAAAPLFEPRIPGGADVRALSDFFAPQAGRAPTLAGKAECRRIEPRAAVSEVFPQGIIGFQRHAEPVGNYTRIKSLLLLDKG
ncbi:hypothetical protein ATER59S_00058 [Aquamicrobium terrae]